MANYLSLFFSLSPNRYKATTTNATHWVGRLSCNLYDIKERALQADTDLRYNSYHPYHNYPVWNDRKLCHHHPMSHCDWLHKNTIETL